MKTLAALVATWGTAALNSYLQSRQKQPQQMTRLPSGQPLLWPRSACWDTCPAGGTSRNSAFLFLELLRELPHFSGTKPNFCDEKKQEVFTVNAPPTSCSGNSHLSLTGAVEEELVSKAAIADSAWLFLLWLIFCFSHRQKVSWKNRINFAARAAKTR